MNLLFFDIYVQLFKINTEKSRQKYGVWNPNKTTRYSRASTSIIWIVSDSYFAQMIKFPDTSTLPASSTIHLEYFPFEKLGLASSCWKNKKLKMRTFINFFLWIEMNFSKLILDYKVHDYLSFLSELYIKQPMVTRNSHRMLSGSLMLNVPN